MRQRCKRILTGGRGWREEEEEEDGQREGGRKGGREGGTNGSLSPSLGCFFQFPVSHCAHSGYVLRLQVCPLLAAFPRLPSVGSGCRGAAADRDRHVMIISLGAFFLSSVSLPPPPSLPAALVLPLGGGRSSCRLRADSGCGGGGGGARREHGRPPGAAVAPLCSPPPPTAGSRGHRSRSGNSDGPCPRAPSRRRLHLLKVTQPQPCRRAPRDGARRGGGTTDSAATSPCLPQLGSC